MSDWLLATILGLIEGLTEFIPVSSTGHLLIAEHLLNIPKTSFLTSDLFNIVIQSGAVVAVIPLFKERFAMLMRWRERESQALLFKIAVAFLITVAGGLVLDKKGYKLEENPIPVAWALLLGGFAFVVLEKLLARREQRPVVTWPSAISVGAGQLAAAVFPGLSRSGSTILAALACGTNRVSATEFSFLVGIPTMLAAGGYKILKALKHADPGAVPPDWGLLALGTIISAIVSFIAVKWLLRFVQSHTFIGFGIYRIIVGAALLYHFWPTK